MAMRYDLVNSVRNEGTKAALIKVSTSSSTSVSDSESEGKPILAHGLSEPRWWSFRKKFLTISVLLTLTTLITATCYCNAVPVQSGYPYGCDPAGNVWVAGSRTIDIWSLNYVLYPTVPLFRNGLTATKAIDICWDVFVGRGYSILAGIVVYSVFRAALVDIMKDYALSHELVLAVQYSTVSIPSVYTHCKECFKQSTTSRRVWPRAIHLVLLQMVLSIAYVLVAPVWLSAMTSYQATMEPMLEVLEPNRSYIIPFEVLTPCAWGIQDGERIGFEDNTCVPSSGLLYDAVLQYTKSEPYLRCYDPRQLNAGTNRDGTNKAPVTVSQDCYLDSNFTFDGNMTWLTSPVLKIEKGTFKYGDHVFNSTHLQGPKSSCQQSNIGEYEWGFSYPLLFSFMVVTALLGLSVLLTWNYYFDRSWPQQMDLVFGSIRTALLVAESVREKLGHCVNEMSNGQLKRSLSAQGDGVKGEHTNSQIMQVPGPHTRKRIKPKRELAVGSEAYKTYLAKGFQSLGEA